MGRSEKNKTKKRHGESAKIRRYELPGRFPPMAVKLNGETARTKPSRGRYSTRLGQQMRQGQRVHIRGNIHGLPCSPRVPRRLLRVKLFNKLHPKAEEVRKLQRSSVNGQQHRYSNKEQLTSAAASISACHAFFPWPRMVAATSLYRYFLLIRSAALRKMAARSPHGKASHAALAARAPSIARATVASSASWYVQRCRAWSEGITCLASFPVLTYDRSASIPVGYAHMRH